MMNKTTTIQPMSKALNESVLNDTYGKQLDEAKENVAENEQEFGFTHIGNTQPNVKAITKITVEKFTENKYGLSQYFNCNKKSESANFDIGADEISQNTTEDEDETSEPKPYSPVLKSSMFQ